MKTTTIFFAAILGLSISFVACKKKKTEDPVVETPANKAPTCTLTSPTTGGAGDAPQTETLSATATDSDGTISKVEFYVGDTKVGTVTSSPYTMQYTFNSNGFFVIKAVATDNDGSSTTSATFDYGIGI